MTNQPPEGDGGDDDRPDRAHRLTYEIDGDESPSIAVVRAVAALTDTSPLDLDPLYDVVDPEHLDGLFEGTGDDTVRTESTFTFDGCEVTVTDDVIHVERIDSDRRS